MKKFTNRTAGLKALYGFIVGAAVLFAACSNPASPPPNAEISTVPGTGQVRVSIAGEDFAPAASVRTIYPTQPTLYYVYTFTKNEAGAVGQDLTTVDGTFTLTTGDWNLTVTAYLEAELTNLAATGSTGAAFTVTEGVSTPVSVTLEPEKSTGSGTLTYTVTYPAGATLDSLDWKKLGGAGPTDLTSGLTPSTAEGVTTLTGTKTAVDAGYYVITAALTDGNKTAGKKEVVHIYQNLTTEAAFTFEADDFTLGKREPISITADNLSQMSTLIAAEAAERGSTSSTDPIVVSVAIDDASLLSGSTSYGPDPLRKLFDAIPNRVYVAYDLSGCSFDSIRDTFDDNVNARPNKTYLASITLPDTLTTIGNYAFSGCSRLTSVTIPDSVTSIGMAAFWNCSGLTSVTFGDSVTSIGDSAFWDCKGLTSVTIPASVTSIGNGAFYGCSNLSAIQVNASNSAYSAIDGVLLNKPGTELLVCPEGKGSYTIPDGVTYIGNSAFSNCSRLTSVIIPDSVTSIGGSAFSGCSGLTSVTIPDSVTSIGGSAFSGCSGLTSVTFGDSVTSIGLRTFADCNGLTSIVINANYVANNFRYVLQGANFSGLTSVTIGGSVISIGEGTFKDCRNLTSVIIGDSVTSIGNEAFSGCSSLTSVIIPDSVTSIGGGAFYGCSGLTSVTFGDSVTSIGGSAFSGCSSLTSVVINTNYVVHNFRSIFDTLTMRVTTVTIGDSVTSIGASAFANCRSLTAVIIPDSVTSIGDSAFYNCEGLTAVTIPDGVTSIGESMFFGCSGLTSVTIPDSVTSIGVTAFHNCGSLTSVTIPDSVTTIGMYAFGDCSSLTSVYVLRETPPTLGSDVFNNNNASLIIHVPAGVVTGYQAAWSAYSSRIEAGSPPTP
ncbi:hypothetical protein AGMMS4952_04360 [Spirochaetia bacterium]|nr:hypothetical protein AGMMS4952_04360 [Spirochaetia bacterium]